MKKRNLSGIMSLAIIMVSLMMLFGCGSGTATIGEGGQGTMNGTAVKGPVSGATVTAYGITNGMMGSQIASSMTDSQGVFLMTIGGYSGPMMLLMSGGTYTDEATGTTMSMAAGDVMTAVISDISSGTTITGMQITPLTSMAQTMAQHMTDGMTAANISAANAAIGSQFIVSDILTTRPMNPLMADSGSTATLDMRNYGMSIAAMSEYAKDMGMTSSSAMVTAMMDDSSDGVMNGMMGTSTITMGSMSGGMMGGGGTMMQPTAGTSGLAAAMTTFMGSAQNRSGLTSTDMNALIMKLSASTGQLQ